MIISVTLNAAIDRTVAVPNLRLGHRHRSVAEGSTIMLDRRVRENCSRDQRRASGN